MAFMPKPCQVRSHLASYMIDGNALTGNTAWDAGGGAFFSTLNNCTLSGNSAVNSGGGAFRGTLINCTLTGNAASEGGGAEVGPISFGGIYCVLINCIVYFNTAPQWANYDPHCQLSYCCTTPLPTDGIGNISADPQLTDSAHLSAGSPCRGAGSTDYVSGTDIDGEPWADPPSIGCDEYYPEASGLLQVTVTADYTNVATGFVVNLTGSILGHANSNRWDLGDGTIASNTLGVSHAWTNTGDHVVSLSAYNETYPASASATVTIHVVSQLVHYVSLTSPYPLAPYTSWATAATSIQDAVDAATVGDLVLVTNGTYASGGETVDGYTFNQVVVDKPLNIRSVNGNVFTVIDGGLSNRCVYLGANGSLAGFTLTNAGADYGIWCTSGTEIVSNCVISGNLGGGGAYQGTLVNCILINNYGYGAYSCSLSNCSIVGNLAGGAYSSSLNNCVVSDNQSDGTDSSSLVNCAVFANSGFGIAYGTANNCTVSSNTSGGAYDCTLNNCIVFFNNAGSGANYDSSSSLNYCCATPLPPRGGNISDDPRLTDSAHVSADSPCVGAGSAALTSGVDIDGEPWANPPSIGCDEFHTGPVTGPLTVSMAADYTNVVMGFVLNFAAQINGHATVNFWDFGDGTFAINEACGLTHSFTSMGDYMVMLWAYNDTYPMGVSATLVIHVENGVHYVSAANPNPVPPYNSWATAATNIQDAVDLAPVGGTILVTNGAYTSGGRGLQGETNRVLLDKPLALQSVNGPGVTFIDGAKSARCVYLSKAASLSGFTLTNGAANGSGGGVFCESMSETVSDCTINGNQASYGGGGACSGTLLNCTLRGNSANFEGGGAYYGFLKDCVLTGNSAVYGGGGCTGATLRNCALTSNSANGYDAGIYEAAGGVSDCYSVNCIVYFNTCLNRPGAANHAVQFIDQMKYCCTTPLPPGPGNVTSAPLFVDQANGNLRLQSNSPCINAGNNAYAPAGPDLDGNPRIAGGTVDIGAYEFQTPTSVISYAWLQQYGLPTDGTADYTDLDGDGLNNWQEWRTGTNPKNSASVLKLQAPTITNNPPGLTVSWQSVAGINYFLQSSTNLPLFITIGMNITGQAGTTTYTDTNAVGPGPFFYRVGVQ
jgi:hypothetical protein